MTTHEWSPLPFAHRGGMADRPENSLDAFRHAVDSGLPGVETDVWITADGQPILHHSGWIRSWRRLKRAHIDTFRLDDLPSRVPTLESLFELTGDTVEVAVDVKDRRGAATVVERAPDASRLWLAHAGFSESDWRLVARWRELSDEVRLIDSTTMRRLDLPLADYARRAFEAGIGVINMPVSDWSRANVETVSAAGVLCGGFRANGMKALRNAKTIGLDIVFGDHCDQLAAVCRSQGADRSGRPDA